MNFFNKTAVWGLLLIVSFLQFSGAVFAANPAVPEDTSTSGTVLPSTKKTVVECEYLMGEVAKDSCWVKKEIFNTGIDCGPAPTPPDDVFKPDIDPKKNTSNDILACGIKTGSIHLWMIPYYIRYILQFIIGMSGLAAVGGIVYGGYLYLFAGVSNEKDQGKKAIQYGVIGMVMTLVAWAFVNIIISLVTG